MKVVLNLYRKHTFLIGCILAPVGGGALFGFVSGGMESRSYAFPVIGIVLIGYALTSLYACMKNGRR